MAQLARFFDSTQCKELLQTMKELEPKEGWESGKLIEIPRLARLRSPDAWKQFEAKMKKVINFQTTQISFMILDRTCDFAKCQFPPLPPVLEGDGLVYFVLGNPLVLAETPRFAAHERSSLSVESGMGLWCPDPETQRGSTFGLSSRMTKDELSPNWKTFIFRISEEPIDWTSRYASELRDTLIGYEKTLIHTQTVIERLRHQLGKQ